jgi:hypothetical protein
MGVEAGVLLAPKPMERTPWAGAGTTSPPWSWRLLHAECKRFLFELSSFINFENPQT